MTEIQKQILPGSTIGIIGGGQLGQMIALKAIEMGYSIAALDPAEESPIRYLCKHYFQAAYDDEKAIESLFSVSDVVTYEFENVPFEPLKSKTDKLNPGIEPLRVARNRMREKQFAKLCNVNTTEFFAIQTEQDLYSIPDSNYILKTTEGGYDGKGQFRFRKQSSEISGELPEFKNNETNEIPYIAEEIVDFSYECSVIATRFSSGQIAMYGPIFNEHKNGILHISSVEQNSGSLFEAETEIAIETRNDAIKRQAFESVWRIGSRLKYTGTFAVEFFAIEHKSLLLFNEMAPRPHNSGHLTIETFDVSQFENHIRAICNLNPVRPVNLSAGAMLNLIGEMGQPEKAIQLLIDSNHHLHLYSKKEVKPGRKMGHLTITASTEKQAKRMALQLAKN